MPPPEQDVAVIVCQRTDMLREPETVAGPERETCETCGAEVWVSMQTLLRVGRTVPGARVEILCNRCGVRRLDEQPAEEMLWVLTPQQRWMRPFLPRGRGRPSR